jgi:hypothetical protein
MSRKIRSFTRIALAGATALAIVALQAGAVFAGGRIP